MKQSNLKRRIVAICLLISVMGIMFFTIVDWKNSKEIVVTLVDIEGDRSVLDDIQLVGGVSDYNSYIVEFKLNEGGYKQRIKRFLTKKDKDKLGSYTGYGQFEDAKKRRLYNLLGKSGYVKAKLYYHPSAEEMVKILNQSCQQYYGGFCEIQYNQVNLPNPEQMLNVEIEGEANELDVYLAISREGEYIAAPTQLKFKREGQPIRFEESYLTDTKKENEILYKQYYDVALDKESRSWLYSAYQEPGLACIEEKLYFTPIVDMNYSGKSYIWRLEDFYQCENRCIDYKDGKVLDLLSEKGKITPIYEIDLENEAMEVIGLESLNDNLVLILKINNQLCFRSITKEGKLLDNQYVEIQEDYFIYWCEALCQDSSMTLEIRGNKENYDGDYEEDLIYTGKFNVDLSDAVIYNPLLGKDESDIKVAQYIYDWFEIRSKRE